MPLARKILHNRLGIQKEYINKYEKFKKFLFWIKTGFGYGLLQ
ncbi:MAG: hypothetical protein ACI8ZM_001707 [Crocinitomix sp.]|jgi:hypothetical protein